MTELDPVIAALAAAVAAQPQVLDLRLHLIELLIERARFAEALTECGTGLGQLPGEPRLLEMLRRATDGVASAAGRHPTPRRPFVSAPDPATGFDWSAAESQLGRDPYADGGAMRRDNPGRPLDEADTGVLDLSVTTLHDVGGMQEVKRQLELTLFGPLRNPALARAYRTSARGGLLLYGPPGCGKSFIADAIAGELGARFYNVRISDVLHPTFGQSEQALRSIFVTARRNTPCVVFFDELDALGHKRSALNAGGLRPVVNQLLVEMDSGTSDNDGVYILGATNHPWDVDVALRRPGRFDRMIFVTPPDHEARVSILGFHLRDRPVVGVDLGDFAARTEGFTGADLAHVCNLATQHSMARSIESGQVQPVTTREMSAALAQVRPSSRAWFDSVRSVLEFANTDGSFDDLARYLSRKRK
ncbi:MAG: ATP-binding protein [Gordonia sp. (in: high G+C Gram-positive bacteria)]